MTALWNLFLNCLEEANAHCTFIIIDDIDALRIGVSHELSEEVKQLIQKLDALVQDRTKLVKILLTASLAKDPISASDGQAALTHSRQRTSSAIVENKLALVPHNLIEIHERRCKTIPFAEMVILYGPNKTVYTLENGELQAFVVIEPSEMHLRSFESYSPLQLRAWSVDHNRKGLQDVLMT